MELSDLFSWPVASLVFAGDKREILTRFFNGITVMRRHSELEAFEREQLFVGGTHWDFLS